jgi:hypothetical protein
LQLSTQKLHIIFWIDFTSSNDITVPVTVANSNTIISETGRQLRSRRRDRTRRRGQIDDRHAQSVPHVQHSMNHVRDDRKIYVVTNERKSIEPKIFDGINQHPFEFLKAFERCSNYYSWNDKKALREIRAYFDRDVDEDLTNYFQDIDEDEQTLTHVKKWLSLQYGGRISDAQAKGHIPDSCGMTEGENARGFIRRIQKEFQSINRARDFWNMQNPDVPTAARFEKLKETEKVDTLLRLLHRKYQLDMIKFIRRGRTGIGDFTTELQKLQQMHMQLNEMVSLNTNTSTPPSMMLRSRSSASHAGRNSSTLAPMVTRPLPPIHPSRQQQLRAPNSLAANCDPNDTINRFDTERRENERLQEKVKEAASAHAKVLTQFKDTKTELEAAKRELKLLKDGTETLCIWCMTRDHSTTDCPERCSRCGQNHSIQFCTTDWQNLLCSHCRARHDTKACPWVTIGIPKHFATRTKWLNRPSRKARPKRQGDIAEKSSPLKKKKTDRPRRTTRSQTQELAVLRATNDLLKKQVEKALRNNEASSITNETGTQKPSSSGLADALTTEQQRAVAKLLQQINDDNSD